MRRLSTPLLAAALGALLGAAGCSEPCKEGYGEIAGGGCAPLDLDGGADGDQGGDDPADDTGGDGADDGSGAGDDGAGDDGAGDDGGGADSDDGGDGGGDEGDDGSGDGGDTGERAPPAASWTADEVADSAARTLSEGLPTPLELSDTWKQLMDAGRDFSCPPSGYDLVDGDKGCTSTTGWRYNGYAEHTEEGGNSGESYHLSMATDAYIIDGDGEIFSAGLEVELNIDGGPKRGFDLNMAGTTDYPAADGWLERGVDMLLGCDGFLGGEGLSMQCLGGFSLVGEGALFLNTVIWEPGCEGGGELLVREDSGYWYSIDLDCGGCGEVTFDGRESVGEACVDLSALAAVGAAVVEGP